MAGHVIKTRSITGKVARIKFLSDEDIIEHTPKRNTKKRVFTENSIKESESQQEDENSENENLSLNLSQLEIEENRKTPIALCDENERIGTELFTFETSKGRGLVMKKALAQKLQMKKSSGRLKISQNDQPKISHSKKSTKVVKKSRSGKPAIVPTENPTTPYNLRRRITQRLAKLAREEEHFSESSDSDESNHSGSNENVDITKAEEENVSNSLFVEEIHLGEKYFRAHMGKSTTSNHTLSRLENPLLDRHSLLSTLKSITSSHSRHVNNLYSQHIKLFKKWMFQLSEGFNLLFYGLGSKRQLLLEFRETMLTEMNSLVVNGFFTNLTLKNILQSILEDVLNIHSLQNLDDMLNAINSSLSKSNEDLYLIIHNIDGVMLRSQKAQSILCKLAQIKQICIVASIDHINAPLIWDQNQLIHFNWIWHDATTFLPYSDETSFENTLLVQPSNTLVLSSLLHVFRSLNPKAKRIFLMLAQYQLDNRDNSTYIGMSYQDCYHKCREAFLVNSDLTLKAQLTEFKDHKLIKSKKGPDSIEHLYIPLETNALADFVEQNKVT